MGTSDEEGAAVFDDVILSSEAYTVEVTAEGYQLTTLAIEVEENVSEVTILLRLQVLAEVTAESASLRSGPSTAFAAAGEVNQGDVVTVVGQSEDGSWLLVETAEGEQGWLALTAATLQQGDLAQVAALPSPPTPTPAPTTVVVATPAPPAPAGGQPIGPNLLTNSGFEEGEAGWSALRINTAAEYPMFVHSGNASAISWQGHQRAFNVTPGLTYRVGAWARLWSSSGQDRNVSENPNEHLVVDLCINTVNLTDRWAPTVTCVTGRPLDTWQYMSVDTVATTDVLVVILYGRAVYGLQPPNNIAVWDDVYLGLSPVAATATPGPPVPPAPVPFDAVALRDKMVQMQSLIEQMGGLLDRVYNGESGSCSDYRSYYRQVVESSTYHSIPPEWQGVYNEYVWASDHIKNSSDAVYQLCVAGGGSLSPFNYGVGRSGIFDTLARLIPAVAQANTLLGQ